MNIVALLFERFTALDVIGPYEVLSRFPNANFQLTGKEKKEYQDSYGLSLRAEKAIGNIEKADLLFIPGGYGIDDILNDKEIIEWIQHMHRLSQWTISVCSGSLLLAAAGVLNDKKCTTHWRRMNQLRQYNVLVQDERYVHDGKIITSAGVSAGIDMALYLVSKMADDKVAKMIQLAIEYDPHPPFDYGSPHKADSELLKSYSEMSTRPTRS
jgi:transcriptional regulator GlxA family with amidase domain